MDGSLGSNSPLDNTPIEGIGRAAAAQQQEAVTLSDCDQTGAG